MLGILRQIETSAVAFDRALRTRSALSGHAILTHFAGLSARTAMRGIVGQVKTTVRARNEPRSADANILHAQSAGPTRRVAARCRRARSTSRSAVARTAVTDVRRVAATTAHRPHERRPRRQKNPAHKPMSFHRRTSLQVTVPPPESLMGVETAQVFGRDKASFRSTCHQSKFVPCCRLCCSRRSFWDPCRYRHNRFRTQPKEVHTRIGRRCMIDLCRIPPSNRRNDPCPISRRHTRRRKAWSASCNRSCSPL